MLKPESYKRGLFFSTVLNIIAKGIGFFNSLLIAFYFGTNTSTDIYFYVLSVAILITNTINGIDYLVLVPEAMKLREREGESSSQRFLNLFIWIYGGIGLFLSLLIVLSPVFFYSLFSKFNTGQLQQNSHLLYIGSVIIVFQLLNNLMNAILVSYKYFTIPIITSLINSLLGIILTVAFHKNLGITGTILGISSGYVLNFIILVTILRKYQKWNFLKIYRLKNKEVWKNILLIQSNIVPVWIRNYIVLYLLSGLGAGIITSLNLGQMLALLPEVFILSQIASIAGIKFSELAAKEKYEDASRLLSNLLNTLFVLLTPFAIVMAVANKELIQLAFQRGGFTESSAAITALCFFYFALILPSKIYDVTFTRLFTSFQVYGLPTLIAVIGHFIITIITFFAIREIGLKGYFISLIIGYYVIMPVIFYIVLRLRLKKLETKAVIKNFFLTVIALPAVYFLCNTIYNQLHFHAVINILIIMIVSSSLIVIISNYTLDLKYFWSLLRQARHQMLIFRK